MNSRLSSTVSYEHGTGLMEPARLRQGCYRFFGALFLYPDQARLTNLVEAAGELRKGTKLLAGSPFLGPWGRLLATLQGLEHGRAEVEGEYVRLFLVKPQAPPYESFYIDPKRLATGWITAQLARDYAEKGLALSSSLREPPDHAAVELEFMAFLCNEEAHAWEREDLKEGPQILEYQRAFLGQHLACWFPTFVRQVASADQVGLYAAAAEAAGAFMHHDQDLIALLLERFQTLGDIS